MRNTVASPESVPLAPGAIPVLGHVLQLWRRPLQFMDALRDHGPVVRINLGTLPAYVVTDPDATHSVLIKDAKSFEKGGRFIEALRRFAGDGLATTADGGLHRRQRRLMQPMFNRSYLATRADSMIGLVRETVQSWPAGEARDMDRDMEELTLSTFLTALFGAQPTLQVRREFHRLLPDVMAGTLRATILPGWLAKVPLPAQRRYHASLIQLRRAISDIVDGHECRRRDDTSDGDDGGLLAMLLDARDEETGRGMSRTQLEDEVITFLTSNAEATTSTLVWALCEIARNPEVERRVHEEVDRIRAGRPLRYDDLPELTYTRLVIQETLRRYGPVWLLTRRATRSVTLGGRRIPAGANVIFSPYLLQQDPSVFPDPKRFDPDRWSGDQSAAVARSSSFIPFGAGSRQCIAESFAWLEMTIIVAEIAARWRLEAGPGDPRQVARVTVHPDSLIMTPRGR